MKITPFEKVVGIPNGIGGRADILASSDLIDVMDRFQFQTLKATNKPYYRGISGYFFDAQIHIGFSKDYKISDVEMRNPFGCLEGEGVLWNDLNLIRPTLQEVQDVLNGVGITTELIDVGLGAPEIGASFFSNDFEDDLAVRLDAITVHLNRCPT